jgi:hypothetical protein
MVTMAALAAVLTLGIILGRAWQARIDQRTWLAPRKIEHEARDVMDGIGTEARQAEARMRQVAFHAPRDDSGWWER